MSAHYIFLLLELKYFVCSQRCFPPIVQVYWGINHIILPLRAICPSHDCKQIRMGEITCLPGLSCNGRKVKL